MAADQTHSDDPKTPMPESDGLSTNEPQGLSTDEPEGLSKDEPEGLSAKPSAGQSTGETPTTAKPATDIDSKDIKQQHPHSGISKLALVLSVIALGASSWLGYQILQQQPQQRVINTLKQQLESTFTEQHQQRLQVKERLSSVETRLEELIQARQQLTTALTTQQQAVLRIQRLEDQQQALSQALAQATAQQNQPLSMEWRLNEVEFLLRLAAEQIAIAENPERAATALKAAIEPLIALDLPLYQPVLEAIHQSLLDLEQLPEQHTGQTHAQLLAIQQTLSSKPRLEQNTAAQSVDKDRVNKDNLSESRLSWPWFKARLQQAFFIALSDAPKTQVLTPDAHSLIVSQSLLLLEQAQTALLIKDNEWYQSSLIQAQHTIGQLSGAHIEAIKKRLQGLQQVNISQKLPDLSSPLNLFISLRKRQQQGTQARAL